MKSGMLAANGTPLAENLPVTPNAQAGKASSNGTVVVLQSRNSSTKNNFRHCGSARGNRSSGTLSTPGRRGGG